MKHIANMRTVILAILAIAILAVLVLAVSPSAYAMDTDTTHIDKTAAPVELDMDSFQPVREGLGAPDMEPAPRSRVPYQEQHPESATSVSIRTPGGRYESSSFRLDTDKGEIAVEADGMTIILDNRNVAACAEGQDPAVYPARACTVLFS